jgi:hypothetical protein
MRSFVSLLAAFATVMHLTCGCCLHATHAGGPSHAEHGSDCCGVAAVDVAEARGGCECDGHACDADGGPVPDESVRRVVASVPEGGHHDCSGCDCVADASENDVAASWRPLASGITAAIDARVILAAAGAAVPTADDGEPPVIPERHPLHERLLV